MFNAINVWHNFISIVNHHEFSIMATPLNLFILTSRICYIAQKNSSSSIHVKLFDIYLE